MNSNEGYGEIREFVETATSDAFASYSSSQQRFQLSPRLAPDEAPDRPTSVQFEPTFACVVSQPMHGESK